MKPNRIEPLLHILVASLVVLATSLLALGQQAAFAPLLATACAIASVYLVDLKKSFALTREPTIIIAVLIVVWLVFQILLNNNQSQLLNVANIVIFLQCILLLQAKDDGIRWQIIALSLIQVAVAAALNLGFMFGVLLVFYVLLAMFTLAVFYVYREIRDLSGPKKRNHSIRGTGANASEETGFAWHSATDVSAFVINRSFLGRLGSMAFLTFLGTVLLFFAIPRYSDQVWDNQGAENVSTVGFTEEVELNDIGRILENPEQVMRVELANLDRSPYYINDEPYFRGTVLSDYALGKGVWRQRKMSESNIPFDRMRSPDLSSSVVQRITLQPGSHSVLFNLAPAFYRESDEKLDANLNLHTRQLSTARDRKSKKALRYQLETSAFRTGRQTDWLAVIDHRFGRGIGESEDANADSNAIDSFADDWRFVNLLWPWSRLESDQAQSLAPIKAVADEVIAQQDLQDATVMKRATALTRHFSESQRYRYSLDITPVNRRIDPIVDFIQNHRKGHCEFYASALALMLRSQGIPARLVVGYHGGDFNSVGSYYTVRQLHAHAWVEAYIGPDEVPAGVLPASEDRGRGAWLRLDPTPSGGTMEADLNRLAILTKAREIFDYCQVLWDEYVLGLNSERQQKSIYQPLRFVVYYMFGKDIWQDRMSWLKRLWYNFITGRWVTWQSTVLLAILSPLLYMMRHYLRAYFAAAFGRLFRRGRRALRTRPGERLFDRLERVLLKRGMQRTENQTPFEFASDVFSKLASAESTANVAAVPQRIVNAFYRVRFGSQTLTTIEADDLDRLLSKLEQALAKR